MAELRHIIADELGMHARPAAQIVKRCSAFECDITIGTPMKMVDAKRVMGVMSLALKKGDELVMKFKGPDDKQAAADLKMFLAENL